MGAIGQQIGVTGMALDVILVVILILMIWKPGL
jgi:biopolymer transport protein ExbD